MLANSKYDETMPNGMRVLKKLVRNEHNGGKALTSSNDVKFPTNGWGQEPFGDMVRIEEKAHSV